MVLFFRPDECSRSKSVIIEKQKKKNSNNSQDPKNIIFISFIYLFFFGKVSYPRPNLIFNHHHLLHTDHYWTQLFVWPENVWKRILHYQIIRTETSGEYNCLPGQLGLLIKIHFILQICLKFTFCACIFEQHKHKTNIVPQPKNLIGWKSTIVYVKLHLVDSTRYLNQNTAYR